MGFLWGGVVRIASRSTIVHNRHVKQWERKNGRWWGLKTVV